MDTPRPPTLLARTTRRALQEFSGAIGENWVLFEDEDRGAYSDPYALGDVESYVPAAIVAPGTLSEIQRVLKIANRYRVPLWPISRGKNLGYGGAAPCTANTVVLDLGRLNRILEVDERYGYCVIEPGVSFFDLFAHLQNNGIPLWLSVPGNSWGSVLGNALEHGIGPFPYGDHASKLCGLEVVLPDGDVVRTGMGAMNGNRCRFLFKHSYGPAWDQMFTQSNFGVVTHGGLWLMPQPEATHTLSMNLLKDEDLEWAIDLLFRLRMSGVLQAPVSLFNPIRSASLNSRRREWYTEVGPLPDEVIQKMMADLRCGRWRFTLRLYGHPDVNAIHARRIKDTFAAHTKSEFSESQWDNTKPFANSGAGIPSTAQLSIVNWWGSRGGHLDFSPLLPPSGAEAIKQSRVTQKLFESHGFDYSGGFTLGERHLHHICMILYDRDDKDMTTRAGALFRALVSQAAADGLAEYRAHVKFMDDVAKEFSFNDHALLRLNERVKRALDPNGIIAPGKQGIWPSPTRSRGR